mgnify:CR=1 FL=1
MMIKGISVPQAMRQHFNVELAKHKNVKDLVYPFIRGKSGFIPIHREDIDFSDKKNIYIKDEGLTKFLNAVVLQGFFSDSKHVKKIFSDIKVRLDSADFIEHVLVKRQSIVGVSLQNKSVDTFLGQLKNANFNLSTERLINPFIELPQISLKGCSSLMQAALAQSATISTGDTMMMHFFEGDLKKAYSYAIDIKNDNGHLGYYKKLIIKDYNEANEFDSLLDQLLN